jgi:hypothetical protein
MLLKWFSVWDCHFELIICVLDFLKIDFGEVDEAMLQGVDGPCELIFCNLGINM